MVKMKHKNRPNQWKEFSKADVEQAKKNGWTLFDAPKPKKAKKNAKRA
tara:strand:- start:6 stop:149 length:144 start_codon:yes stop_codon:yes gene_type:complete